MELDLEFRKVFCCGASDEKKAVLPVDCSIILPDYFPDVMKILRYTAKTVKSPVFSEGGAETVSGNVNIEVNYVSEEGELCSCSQLQPFSHSFDCGGNVSAAEADIRIGEIGCRAVNKRRIDLHGSIEILLRTLCGEEKNFVSSASGAGAVCKSENSENIMMVGEFYKNFTIEEKGELGYGKPPFGKVLRCSAFAEVTECHVIQDKIVTKGEVRVSLLWQPEYDSESEEKGPCFSTFTFPVSRMVDANGILLTDTCDARYEADFPEISPAEDGQNVGIKLKVGIFARAYRKNSVEYLTDMFSTDYESKCERGRLSVMDSAMPISMTENIYEKFELPESAETVTDMWTEVSSPRVTAEGKIAFDAKLCMFAKDADENPLYFEKTVERELSSPAQGRPIAFHNVCAGVRSEEFSSGRGREAEISASVLIDGTVYTAMSTDAITACSVSTDKKLEHDSAAIVLCYAEKGEPIWDIAKKYRATVEDIMIENGISADILQEKAMLVIPR
ncbi:MAG: DUF3794 domain-containing protein [Oscillospiraceae bacterium]|nr:DUF3794 domain-containing protein [Oscillospiraceae bacterium]